MLKKIIGSFLFGTMIYFIRYYFIGKLCKCTRSISNDLIIITGATSGIGLSTAKQLAAKGAGLILACRDIEKGKQVCANLQKLTGNINIYVEEIDFSSLESVRNFAQRILNSSKPIYALINNVGIFYAKSSTTIDNIELTLQTNYVGHFLLTILLLPALRKYQNKSRIINISSKAHLQLFLFPQPELHHIFDDTSENRFKAYIYSKFCMVLFSYKLSQILSNSNITVHCVDPGNTETDIFRNFTQLSNSFYFYLQKPIRILIIKTATEGSQSIIHAILNKSPPFYIYNLKESTEINLLVFEPIYSLTLWLMSRKLCKNHLISMN